MLDLRIVSRSVSILSIVSIVLSSLAPAYAGVVPYYRSSGSGSTAPTPSDPEEKDDTDATGGLRVSGLTSSVRARIGVPFSLAPIVSGADAAPAWSLVGAALPSGISLTPAGVLSGIPASIGAVEGVRLRVQDTSGKFGLSRTFTLDVKPTPSIAFANASHSFEAGLQAAITPQARDVYGSATWSLTGGRLPFGLALDPATGRISGTPEQEGSFTGLQLTVIDADGATGVSPTFAATVTSSLKITGLEPTYAMRVGRLFSMTQPQVTGAAGNVTWSLAAGTLPAGVILDAASGALSGMPKAIGSTEIRIRVTDQRAHRSIVSSPIAISILGDPTATVEPRTITRLGDDLRLRPQAFGMIGSPIWSFVGGAMPRGFRFEPSDGAVGGVVTALGTSGGLTWQVMDSRDGSTGRAGPAAVEAIRKLKISAASQPYAKVGRPFSWDLPTAEGVYGTATWDAQNLAPGLTFDRAAGKIVGTPTTQGPSMLTVEVTDSYDGRKDTRISQFVVQPVDAPEPFAVSGVTTGYFGKTERTFSTPAPTITGATGTVSWTLASGALPSGFSLDATSGVISGLSAIPLTISNLTLRARDAATANSVLSTNFTIYIQTPVPLGISVQQSSVLVVNQDVEITPQTISGEAPLAYRIVAGQLPGWANLNPSTGEITGTAAEIGRTDGLVMEVADAEGAVATSNTFSLIVSTMAAPSIVGLESRYYGATATLFATPTPRVTNADGAVEWSLGSGSLPEWAALDPATGVISGTPTASGSIEGLSLRVIDSRNISSVSAAFGITIRPSALAVSLSRADYTARQGQVINTVAPTLSGASGPTSFSVTGASLPAWASFSPQTGRISASSDDKTAIAGLVIRAQDGGSGQSALTQPISIAFVAQTPTINVRTQYLGVASRAFTAAPSATDLVGDAVWSLADGQLPSWAALDPATGKITGTPPAAQSMSGLRLRLVDADGVAALSPVFSIEISPKPPIDIIAEDAQGRIGRAFAMTPAVEPADQYAWSVEGSLPQGLGVDPANGRISGTPSSSGAYVLVLKARDTTSAVGTSLPFTLTIQPALTASAGELAATIHSLSPYVSAPALAQNAQGKVAWSLEGSLPSGLSLDPATGAISGTPVSDGASSFRLRALDAFDGAEAVSSQASIAVLPAPAIVMEASYPGRENFPVSVTPNASNLIGQATWTLAEGDLPTWATLNASSGAIAGTPGAEGQYGPFRLKVVDSRAGAAISQPFSIAVTQAFQAEYGPASYVGRIGRVLTTTAPTASGHHGAVVWSSAGQPLPTGFTLDPATGVISGTPEVAAFASGLRIRGRDSAGATVLSPAFVINVASNPAITTRNAATRVNADFLLEPQIAGAIDGQAVSLESGALPTWAVLNPSTGGINGRPTAQGSHTLSLRVVDGEGAIGISQPFTITVGPGMTVSGVSGEFVGRAGRGFTGPTPKVAGATTPSWTFDGAKPDWMQADATTGSVSGVPTGAGLNSGLKLKVTDAADGATAVSGGFDARILGSLNIQNVPSSYVAHVGRPFAYPAPVAANVGGVAQWSLAQGALPTWATIDATTGRIVGTPQEVTGATPLMRLGLRDSADGATVQSREFSVAVVEDIDVVSVPTAFTARFGFPFASAAPLAINSVGPAAWSIDRGVLPSWASLDADTGQIIGTPDVLALTPGLGLRATDASGGDGSSVTFTLNVYSQPAAQVSASAYRMRVGSPFAMTPTVQGIAGVPTWSLAAGTLPAGLSIVSGTGAITGTPLAADYQPLALQVRDDSDGAVAETQGFTFEVSQALKVVGLQPGYTIRTTDYFTSPAPTLQNVRGSITRAKIGDLPSGITFNASTGEFVGSTSFPGDYPLGVRMTDQFDGQSAEAGFTLKVLAGLKIATSPAVTARRDAALTIQRPVVENAVGAIESLTWRVGVGALPPGMTIDVATGVVSGTPTTTGVYQFTHVAKDVDGNEGQSQDWVRVSIVSPMVVSGLETLSAQQNVAMAATSYSVSGANGTTTWTITGLPAGMTSSGSGTARSITGTPTVSGTFQVSVKVRDDSDASEIEKLVVMTVGAAPQLSITPQTIALTRNNAAPASTCTAVTLTNAGLTAATGLSWSIPTGGAQFQVCSTGLATPCQQGGGLAVNGSCQIGLAMPGAVNGTYSGSLQAKTTNGAEVTRPMTGTLAYAAVGGSTIFTADGEFDPAVHGRVGMKVRVIMIGGGGIGNPASGYHAGGGGGSGRVVAFETTVTSKVAVSVGAGDYYVAPTYRKGSPSKWGTLFTAALGGGGGGMAGGNGGGGGGGYMTGVGATPNGGALYENGSGSSAGSYLDGMPTLFSKFVSVSRGLGGMGGNAPTGCSVAGGGGAGGLLYRPNASDPFSGPTMPSDTTNAVNGKSGHGYGAGGGAGGMVSTKASGCPSNTSSTTYVGQNGSGANGAVIVEWDGD